MDKTSIFLVGAGGHAKVVSEIILQTQQWEIAAYIDESAPFGHFLGRPVFKTLEETRKNYPSTKHAFVSIGANEARKKWHIFLQKNDFNMPSFTHSTAWVSDSATLESGVLVCAKAIVGASCFVGESTILNCASILDHDSKIGAFSHLSQGSIACGGSKIGSTVLVGPGSVIEKLAVISDGAMVGSHSVIATARK